MADPEATETDVLAKCLSHFEQDSKHHDVWAAKIDRWYRAWRGIPERKPDDSNWHSQLHPPYIFQVLETLVSGLMDPNPMWRVKPRPRMTSEEEIHQVQEGSRALQNLLSYQRDLDQFGLKQRAHRLQGLIAGATGWKTYWTLEEEQRTRMVQKNIVTPDGEYRITQEEVTDVVPVKDDPCVDVIDMRDFIWHESATSIQNAQRATHRLWMSYDHLKMLEKEGYYRNVDQLKETRDFSNGLANRENDLFQRDRTKDLIEVLEHWCDNGSRVVTIANRSVILSDKPNPFRHGQFPFVICSPIPDMFSLVGVSTVELVEHLQEMLWTISNQRLDNLELINNAIVLVDESTIDKDQFVFAPGQMWDVPHKDAAQILNMPSFPAQVSLEAEALIKADIQNIPGASPALMGMSVGSEQTATEVSLLTNLAQRRLSLQKYQFEAADIQVGEQWIELNRQFLTEARYISIVGADGEEGWELIDPDKFASYKWKIELSQMDESLVRQERRAEEQAKLQVMLQAAPVFAAIGQPLNLSAALDDYLRAYGVEDPSRYLSAKPQPGAAQGAPAGPPGPQQAPTPEDMMAGATAPQAYDANSPSNAFSQSPVAAMQRMGAMSGGPVNGG